MQTAKKLKPNDFEYITDHIIMMMEENSKRFEYEKMELTPLEFVLEHRTIHLSYGRRIGKTEYINNHATEEDFILLPRLHFSVEYKGKNIGSENILANKSIKTFKTIYVDEPRLHNRLDDCLNHLIKNHDQTVVIFGR